MGTSGIDLTTKVAGAGIIALAFVSIAFNNVTATRDLNAEVNADIDARRLAQAIQVIDHKTEAQARLNFGMSYDTIRITQNQVIFTEGDKQQNSIQSLRSSVQETSVAGTQSVCIIKEYGGGGHTLRFEETCPARR